MVYFFSAICNWNIKWSKSPPWGYTSLSNSHGLPHPALPSGLTLIGPLGNWLVGLYTSLMMFLVASIVGCSRTDSWCKTGNMRLTVVNINVWIIRIFLCNTWYMYLTVEDSKKTQISQVAYSLVCTAVRFIMRRKLIWTGKAQFLT